MTTGSDPALSPASPVEQAVITAARAARQQCICGGACGEGAIPLPAALAGRLRRYLAEHPGHALFHDQEGNVAMVLDWQPGNPGVRAAPDLETLLDELDAIPVTGLS
jgi:hypothetical protein